MLEEKNWDIKKGDFQKKHIHEEHKRFKKRQKADNVLLVFFVIVSAVQNKNKKEKKYREQTKNERI